MRIAREIGIAVLVAVGVFLLLQWNVGSYTVRYNSMLPSIRHGDWIMVSKASYRHSEIQRGDVIVFDPPAAVNSEWPYIKRVIGLPGELIEVKDGKVFIDGRPLEEPSRIPSPDYTMPAMRVPADEYFVLGDNRNNSNDSHKFGSVSRDDIIGRAWFVYWPGDRLMVIQHFRYPELNGVVAAIGLDGA